MTVNIEIDDALFAFLGKEARPFVETPNDVLRRLLGLDEDEPPPTRNESALSPGLQTGGLAQDASRQRRGPLVLPEFPVRAGAKRVQRISPGEMLPLEKYCPYILQALYEAEGQLRSRQMPEALLPLIGKRLTSVDKELDETGVPRWHKRIGWAGSMCRKAGHLDLSAPRGVWRISELGQEVAASLEGVGESEEGQ